MARKQAADYEQRREAIVEHAARLFASRGFLGASVADLASACGASKSLIYHYYPSKEDILFEVMDSHLLELTGAVETVTGSKAAPERKMRDLTHRFMGLYVGAADRHKVLLNELGHLPDERRTLIVTRQRALIDAVQTLVATVRPDLATPRARRPLTMLFFGMINWTHTWFRPDGAASSDEVADLAADLILGKRSGSGV
jgi:AcrR family transcriptional regulator